MPARQVGEGAMNDGACLLGRIELMVDGKPIDRKVCVRWGKKDHVVAFLIPGFNESAESMRAREPAIQDDITIVYVARRLTVACSAVEGLTTQTLDDQTEEVVCMIRAFLAMHHGRFKVAVLHGHSMGAVIAQRVFPAMWTQYPDLRWHILAEAPPPWKHAPLWFSNRTFWSSGGWAALGDAMKALATNRFVGQEGMISNCETLYQLYAGGQPTRDAFVKGYELAVRDAPLAFMELAFKSGLGDERALLAALVAAQGRVANTPVLQIIYFAEDRIFPWEQVVKSYMARAAQFLLDGHDGHSSVKYSPEIGPMIHITGIPSLPHVPTWGTNIEVFGQRYLGTVRNAYRKLSG